MTTTTMKRATQGTARLLLGLGFALCSGAFAGSAWAISASLTAPANNAVFTAPASITLTATATPTNANRPIAKVEFFRGGATLIGTDTTSPYSFAWTNVPAGTYSLTAKATDSTGATATSTAVSVKVNAPPTVSLTSPANNAVFSPGATIALAATAADSDGTISKVEFFQGTTLIGSDTSSPYSLNWTSVPTGSYSLTARATDSNGAVTTSAPVVITVDSPPTVSITAPANNAIFLPPANVTVSASATDADGTVAKVEFFDGTTLVGTVTAAPFSVTLANLAAGTHTLTARATDDLGLSTTSTAVTIRVDAAPTVSITAPANGAVFTAPAGVTITATATDSDGTVAKVDFFDGATLAGTATAAPYSVTLTNVSAGTHALTARATDNQGAVTTSAAVSIIVNTPPTVSITAPAANAVFTAPANVTITATATDSDGTVAKVDFYAGAALIGTANTAPYTFIWANVAAGSYSLTAVATDNLGASTTSAAVPIAVNAQTTLSASPTSVAVGGTVTATWSGIAAPSTGNFLGLYAPGSNTQLSYLFLNGAASGSLPFTLPDSMAQGTYELRLFAPNSALLAISNSFTAGPPVTVSGTVSASGAVLAGVTFAASNGGTCTTSNASGQYSCTVLQGWSGSVTPSFSGFSLTPASRDYTGVAANVSAQDYTASSTTQLSASPTAVAVGGTLTASWSGIAAPSTGNFLGLYAPGSNTQLSYLFLNGAASGSLPFTLQFHRRSAGDGERDGDRGRRGARRGDVRREQRRHLHHLERLGSVQLHGASGLVGDRDAVAQRLQLRALLAQLQRRERQSDRAELRGCLPGKRDGDGERNGRRRGEFHGDQRRHLHRLGCLGPVQLHRAAGLVGDRDAVACRLHLRARVARLQRRDRPSDGAELCGQPAACAERHGDVERLAARRSEFRGDQRRRVHLIECLGSV